MQLFARKFLPCTAPFALLFAATPALPAAAERRVEITLQVALPAQTGRAELWLPLIGGDARQRLLDRRIEATFPYDITTDPLFHNTLLHARIPDGVSGTLRVTTAVARDEAAAAPARLNAAQRALYLRAERKVTLSPRVRKIAAEITAGNSGAAAKARAIYDYTVAVMSYDKTVPGWGEGDTERACDLKKGNCTDFHSLFISLARASGIPARFIMGYAVPAGAASGELTGYHCWAEFYQPGAGWVPVDASEASKHPEQKEYLFGHLDPDRVGLSLGRDVILAPPQAEAPLNYLLKPYLEVGGKSAPPPPVTLRYRDLAGDDAIAASTPAPPGPG